MGAFAVFFFTLFFLAIGFLLLWNGNSLQGHCCSTTDDSSSCSAVTSKTNCGGDCKWRYWNCDGPFPWQSKYNGPGKADCEDPDSNSQDQSLDECTNNLDECTNNLDECTNNLDECNNNLNFKYHTCTYTITSNEQPEQTNLTTAAFCNNYTNQGDCSALIPVQFSGNNNYTLTNSTAKVNCPKHAEFPGCKWDSTIGTTGQCVVNYPK